MSIVGVETKTTGGVIVEDAADGKKKVQDGRGRKQWLSTSWLRGMGVQKPPFGSTVISFFLPQKKWVFLRLVNDHYGDEKIHPLSWWPVGHEIRRKQSGLFTD